MKPQRIVLLGATGFVGRSLLQRLAVDLHTLIVLSRNRELHRDIYVVPRVRVETTDVYDRSALARHFEGADVVVNLVGILNERGSDGRGFRKAHVELTDDVIAACATTGVRRLIHMSALRAGEGESHYLKTRGEAEAHVRASSLDWTIFRPSVIFGPDDGLFFRFAKLLRIAPMLPLARAHAKFAPVYVGDVAEAFARAIAHRSTIDRTYALYGPEVVELIDIVRRTAAMTGRKRWIVPLPDSLGFVQATIGEWLPGKPISRDNFRSLKLDSVGDEDGLASLGIVATPIDAIMPALLAGDGRQRRYDRFRSKS